MFRKDYIIRMTEEFGKFLGMLYGLKKQKGWAEVEQLIKTAAQKYTRTEIEFAEAINNDVFVEKLLSEHNLNNENLQMLANLLYEKGLMYEATGRMDKRTNAFKKALTLFNYIHTTSLDSDFSLDMHYKMNNLKELLAIKE